MNKPFKHTLKLEDVVKFLAQPIRTEIVMFCGRGSNKSLTQITNAGPVHYILKDHDREEAYYSLESAVEAYNEKP